jgi:serine/threonine-protein kinase
MIDSVRWETAQDRFERALAVSQDERENVLGKSDVDQEIIELVANMLRADAKGNSVFDRELPALAFELLLPAAGPAQPLTEEFGPYRLIRFLGEGGMGVVWLAERTDTRSQVAVKFLPSAGLSPARMERFTHEVRLLARLKHPSIAQFYDAGRLADGTPWFVMEYVCGVSFTEYCRSLNSVGRRLGLFRGVCQAVQHAHGQGIIHRDLKPSNILVEGDGTPKLLDFGIARELQPTDGESGLTAHGPRFMSRHYSAPEWIEDGLVNAATDVYSLGVILYETLAGQLPAVENDHSRAGSKAAAAIPARPSRVLRRRAKEDCETGATLKEIAESIIQGEWDDLDMLCLKALNPDPTQRYGSVEALLRDVDHFLKGEPLDARPDSWRYRAAKFVLRNKRAVATSAAASILIVTAAVAFTVRLATAKDAALVEAARANRIQQFTLTLFKRSGRLADAPNKQAGDREPGGSWHGRR